MRTKLDFNKDLIKIFGNIYEFCKGDINKTYFVIQKNNLSL